MRIGYRITASVCTLALLCGCASVPNVSRPYYFPEGRADIAIIQTVGCMVTDVSKPTDVGTTPLVRSAATATVTYSYVPNYNSPNKHALNVADIDTLLSDSDVALTLTDDGRLTSINATNAGEAAAIVKSIISVAAVFTGVKLLSLNLSPADQQVGYCKTIMKYGAPVDAQKQPGIYTLTLTYKQRLLFPQGNTIADISGNNYAVGQVIPIPLDPGSTPFQTVPAPFPPFSFTVTTAASKDIQPKWGDQSQSGPFIDVPAMMLLALTMTGPVADMSKTGDFWNDTLLVPTDTAVKVPLPTAPLFGKLVTSMQFASSGSGLVNKVEYNKTNGLADLFSAGAQVANQAFPPAPAPQTNTQKAADVQAQADLIYQHQRLVTCQLNPQGCPSK